MPIQAERFLTAEELLALPDDGFKYELVDGRLLTRMPAGVEHGGLSVRLTLALGQYVDAHDLGVVLSADTGFQLRRAPDTVRAPDVAFIRKARIAAGGLPVGYWPGAPDVAVEVVSPSELARDVDIKVREYLDRGSRLVWVVRPRDRSVVVHRPGGPPVTLHETDVLDGGDIVPGFRYELARLFATTRSS